MHEHKIIFLENEEHLHELSSLDKSLVNSLTEKIQKEKLKGEQKSKERIEKVTRDNSKKLILDNCHLKKIPSEVFDLIHIEELDLSNNQIESIPPLLKKLNNLKKLTLDCNHLDAFPIQILELKKLNYLSIQSNNIEYLPNNIGTLSNIQYLDISNSKKNIVLRIKDDDDELVLALKEHQSFSLSQTMITMDNFKRNKIWEIPSPKMKVENKILSKIENVEKVLEKKFHQETSLSSFFKKEKKDTVDLILTEIKNKIKSLPNEISLLEKLEEINVSYNKLESFPQPLTKLLKCKKIHLNFNKITAIPRELKNLSILNTINLSNNKITELDKTFFDIKSLEEINLSNNEITVLPIEIYHLKVLKKFNINSNKISTLPKLPQSIKNLNLSNNLIEIRELESLPIFIEDLNLSSNKINSFPKKVIHLKRLVHLNLSNNKISDIPKSLGLLDQLITLDLSNNNIKRIPSVLHKLEKLKELYLGRKIDKIDLLEKALNNLDLETHKPDSSSIFTNIIYDSWLIKNDRKNSLKKFPIEILKLSQLERLDLSGNQISKLPLEIIDLKKINYLNLKDNPIENIPKEIFEQGAKSIFNYIESINEADEVDYLYEAKLILVGRGFVGKTSLVKTLTIPDYKLEKRIPSTEGIEIKEWNLDIKLEENSKSFRFNIWDFGGQEKYDATHQFFITERSLYLFVTEARQESNYLDFDYWLNTIHLLSNESPIIVIQNKVDERKKQLPTIDYYNKFPSIIDFVNVSCSENFEYTIDHLKSVIRNAIEKLPQVGDALPKVWIEIRQVLEDDTRDYISYQDYILLCRKFGLNSEKARYLARYFHDLGVIVHYYRDLILKKMVIINPDWAVDGVYRVLDNKDIQENNGKFQIEDIEKIWGDLKYQNKQAELLALMKNYELCFEIKETNSFIAPELLPANPPKYRKLRKSDSLNFIYQFKFMPAGILTKLIVKIHSLIERDYFWKFGVILTWQETRAEIIEDYTNKKIKIRLIGENKKDLLAIIRKDIFSISKDFNILEFDEMIPCNCKACKGSGNSHFYKYQILKKYEAAGKINITCENSIKEIKIRSLINDVIIPLTSEELDFDPNNFNTQINNINMAKNNPLKSLSAYLIALIIIFVLLFISMNVAKESGYPISISFPLLIIAAWIFFVLLAAFQLRNDEVLKDKEFFDLVKIASERIPPMSFFKKDNK